VPSPERNKTVLGTLLTHVESPRVDTGLVHGPAKEPVRGFTLLVTDDQENQGTVKSPPLPVLPQPRRTHWIWFAALGLTLLVGLACGIIVSRLGSPSPPEHQGPSKPEPAVAKKVEKGTPPGVSKPVTAPKEDKPPGVLAPAPKVEKPAPAPKGLRVDGHLTINAELTVADPLDRRRKVGKCKVYLVAMRTGKTYQIDMVSKEGILDPYLRPR
jgi:hypothetical protein